MAAEPVKEQLGASVLLGDFLRTAGTLTLEERRILVQQALLLFDQNYAHLPLKVAMHAVNPVQRLRLLRDRLARQTAETADPEWRFHTEMSEIFHSVQDLHTNYLLPAPFAGKIAYLPFLVEEYHDRAGPHYVISHIMQGFSAPGFSPGAEVTHWSGIPIDRAVDLNAARFAGANLAARHARGVESLTIRPLRIHLAPVEEWVTVSYVGTDGTARELRAQWLVVDNLPPLADANTVSPEAAAIGLDLGADEVSRARRLLFAPDSVGKEMDFHATGQLPRAVSDGADLPTTMPAVFRARSITTTSSRTFGHIRIFTFNVEDPDAFVSEFVRLIEQLPRDGLIVDVRGNGGGLIYASEFTLQTLTPRQIQPESTQFINSALNLQICRKHKDNPVGIDLGPWFPSMDQAVETGATFSNAFQITPTDRANAVGQRYHGPVVLITDARCYSATDTFAAGFQDHGIGRVLGVDANTGAGGANVWTQDLLKKLLEVPTPEASSPYQALPKGAGMRVAIRRTLRVGPLAGTPIEDLGVTPTDRHELTRDDVIGGNADLLDHAGGLLAAMPVHKLALNVIKETDGSLHISLDVANLDRADVYVDGRPRASVDLAGPNAEVAVPGVAEATSVRVEGYLNGELAAARMATV